MATFTRSDDLRGAAFTGTDLRGARFTAADLSGVVMRAVDGQGLDMSVFTTGTPSYAEVLEARAGRVAMVRDFIAAVTPGELTAARTNPWDTGHQETTLSCLHTILEEEWEHHRYAVRDLDAIETR